MIQGGDSGAPCFLKISDGVYKLACIVLAGYTRPTDNRQLAYAFPASKARDLLGIQFGKRPPAAKIVQSPLDVRHGDTVVLSGVESTDPDGDPLTYKWFQEPRVGGVGVELSSATAPVTMFTAPSQDTTLVFNLTVTNVVGDTATATVNVVVKAPEPVGPPSPEPPPGTLVDIPPLDIGNLIPEVWSKWLWADVWQGSCENRTRKRFRVYSKGRVEVRWVPDPEPTVWEETGPPTGETRGCGATKEVEQTVGNNCNDETRTVWVAAPEELEWTKTPTGNTRGCGETKETEYTRTSQCGDTETGGHRRDARLRPDPGERAVPNRRLRQRFLPVGGRPAARPSGAMGADGQDPGLRTEPRVRRVQDDAVRSGLETLGVHSNRGAVGRVGKRLPRPGKGLRRHPRSPAGAGERV